MPRNVRKVLFAYEGANGKGTAIRSIFEAAGLLRVRACIVVEARAPGIRPEWLHALLGPILQGDDLAMGSYHRGANAMSLCDNLVYPFLQTFFNADLRDPLAGEFCVSGAMAHEFAACDVWETSVARYGVNVWMALHALVNDCRISQVDLGYRGDGGADPAAALDAHFLHVVSTLFGSLSAYRRVWQRDTTPRHVLFRGNRCADEVVASDDISASLWQAMRDGSGTYQGEWAAALRPETLEHLDALMGGTSDGRRLSPDTWAEIALSFALLFNKGEGDPDKVAEALLPLYYGRTASYLRETQGLTPLAREDAVDEIVRAFLRLKEPFTMRWNTYRPWVEDPLF